MVTILIYPYIYRHMKGFIESNRCEMGEKEGEGEEEEEEKEDRHRGTRSRLTKVGESSELLGAFRG